MTLFRGSTNSRRHLVPRFGFSLLEVIIATAILAGSAMMLMSMFSLGDRHTARAEQRAMAQMLCQSKLDELLADPAQLVTMPANVFRQFPGWVWTVDAQPSTIDGLVRVRVGVTRVPGLPSSADLSLSSSSESETPEMTFTSGLPDKPTFELTRWLRHDREVADTSSFDESASLLERLQAGQR